MIILYIPYIVYVHTLNVLIYSGVRCCCFLNVTKVIICLVLFFIVLNFGFSMIEALLSPFLGDNFGLNIEFISYVFLGVSLVFFLSSIQM